MMQMLTLAFILSVLTLSPVLLCHAQNGEASTRRVPAEYEKQAAIWMQWPSPYERKMEPVFAEIIKVVSQYQSVKILVPNKPMLVRASDLLKKRGIASPQISFQITPSNNAWMRDNGPVYIYEGEQLKILDFGFDAWGGNFGKEVEFKQDNRIPRLLAQQLKLPHLDQNSYILERGNLEVDGRGIAVLNWDCQKDRNPRLSKAEHEALLKKTLGLTRIIWAYGHDPEDLTTGHIDGIARFIAPGQLVVSSYYGDQTEARLAKDAKAAGLKVLRYPGDVNWLVGNGFVLANHDGDEAHAKELNKRLTAFFPGRKIHLIDGQSIASLGGGIHCVTNDQPVAPTKK